MNAAGKLQAPKTKWTVSSIKINFSLLTWGVRTIVFPTFNEVIIAVWEIVKIANISCVENLQAGS